MVHVDLPVREGKARRLATLQKTGCTMSASSTSDQNSGIEPPLWSIGLAVAIILGAPLVLYSLAPTGPLRDGDTIFSAGQQQVRLFLSSTDHRYQAGDTCLLDPNSPLIVLRVSDGQPGSSMVAQVQGNPATEWPFCPLHAEVLLKPHQIFQKPALFAAVQTLLARWVAR